MMGRDSIHEAMLHVTATAWLCIWVCRKKNRNGKIKVPSLTPRPDSVVF